MGNLILSDSSERSAKITIGGTEYEMLLTTKATKEIAKRYGGLSNLGEKLMKSENFEMALDEVIWLITLLANQSVLIHNLQYPNEKRELLTEETVELLTSPFDLAEYKNAIMDAMYKGTKRHIESENEQSKNVVVG
jgi:hypothetical protein